MNQGVDFLFTGFPWNGPREYLAQLFADAELREDLVE